MKNSMERVATDIRKVLMEAQKRMEKALSYDLPRRKCQYLIS
jgi:hypothetical protein